MKLLFVLTFKGSLEMWTRVGIANREMELYFEYLRRGLFTHVQLFSYSPEDEMYLKALNVEPELKERIELILPARKPRTFYDYVRHSVSLGKIRNAVRSGAVICKTNQINGSWTAMIARLFGCCLFIRCGYILSRGRFNSGNWIKGAVALLIETLAFNLASLVSVTTPDARDYVERLMIGGQKRIFVAPTYVNTDIFKADISIRPKDNKVLFVGRLEPIKNVLAMIDACHLANVALTIVGRGSLESQVLKHAKDLDLPLTHYPVVMNEEMVELLRSHRYFLLPSLHEGLPKALIEAMSTEMICIGTPASGIRDLIRPKETGYLAADFSAEAIAAAIVEALDDPFAEARSCAARAYVLERHTIASYVEREYTKIKEALE